MFLDDILGNGVRALRGHRGAREQFINALGRNAILAGMVLSSVASFQEDGYNNLWYRLVGISLASAGGHLLDREGDTRISSTATACAFCASYYADDVLRFVGIASTPEPDA